MELNVGRRTRASALVRSALVRKVFSVIFIMFATVAATCLLFRELCPFRIKKSKANSYLVGVLVFTVITVWNRSMMFAFKNSLSIERPSTIVGYAFLAGAPLAMVFTVYELKVLLFLYPTLLLWCSGMFAVSYKAQFNFNSRFSLVYSLLCGLLMNAVMAPVAQFLMVDEAVSAMLFFASLMAVLLMFIDRYIILPPDAELIPYAECETLAQQMFLCVTTMDLCRIFV